MITIKLLTPEASAARIIRVQEMSGAKDVPTTIGWALAVYEKLLELDANDSIVMIHHKDGSITGLQLTPDEATTMSDGPRPKDDPELRAAQLPKDASRGVCRSCGKPILWVTMRSGSKMPLDPAASENGTIHHSEDGWQAYDAETAAFGHRIGRKFYLSHFATCPNAKSHRKPKA